ncbi:MAG TPA: hypothetical protein VMZ53_28605 [Kofleriaceae bacterium]|nr:hypothetical protein [Kofleriaceae bacterium]
MKKRKPKKLELDRKVKPIADDQLSNVSGSKGVPGPIKPQPSIVMTSRNCCW